MEDMYSRLSGAIRTNDIGGANKILMSELGDIIVNKKPQFVRVLNNAGLNANDSMSEAQLAKLFLDNATNNKELLMKVSYLINFNKAKVGVDGTRKVNDTGVKACYKVLCSGFSGEKYSGVIDPNIIANAIQTGGQVLGKGVDLAGNIVAGNQNIAYQKQFGERESADKAAANKTALLQAIVAGKTAQAEAGKGSMSSGTKTALIVGGAVVGLLIIVGVVVYMKKKK